MGRDGRVGGDVLLHCGEEEVGGVRVLVLAQDLEDDEPRVGAGRHALPQHQVKSPEGSD